MSSGCRNAISSVLNLEGGGGGHKEEAGNDKSNSDTKDFGTKRRGQREKKKVKEVGVPTPGDDMHITVESGPMCIGEGRKRSLPTNDNKYWKEGAEWNRKGKNYPSVGRPPIQNAGALKRCDAAYEKKKEGGGWGEGAKNKIGGQ